MAGNWPSLLKSRSHRRDCLRMAVVMVKTVDSLRSVLCVCAGAMQCIKSLAQNSLWNIFRLRVQGRAQSKLSAAK
jgi:hypothetical protein